jgi:sirohydrochlorin cobaltochelatase
VSGARARSSAAPLRALVLYAHGSRDPRWRQPFEELRAELARRAAPAPVELAYLAFCAPTLEQALGSCAGRGAREALVVPLFLSGGGHLGRDVGAAIAAAAASTPSLRVRASGALGEEPEVREALAGACLRLLAAIADPA